MTINGNALQVAHGTESDVLWLQRDFGVHIVNLFDTYRYVTLRPSLSFASHRSAMRELAYSRLSLEHLVKERCRIDLNKEHRLSDWRIRCIV